MRNAGGRASVFGILFSALGSWLSAFGMTPPELLLASLGSCAGFYAAQYLRKHRLATSGTRVRVTADKMKDPARVENFRIEVEVDGELSSQQRAEWKRRSIIA